MDRQLCSWLTTLPSDHRAAGEALSARHRKETASSSAGAVRRIAINLISSPINFCPLLAQTVACNLNNKTAIDTKIYIHLKEFPKVFYDQKSVRI